MSGGVERKDVYAVAARHGWTIDDKPNSKGYFKMKCPCGKNLKWLHKTPSNPNYYRETIAFIKRTP